MLFEKNEIKLDYAKAKFLFSMGFGVLYFFTNSIFSLLNATVSQGDDFQFTRRKSMILFIIIAILTLLRDKFEKQISKRFS
jgi:hypothetical protein